jgi:prepilin-type N-terminal cleavage/methylation domain-containing protein
MAKRGFTLIEVLIVIAIISVLSTIMLGYGRSSSQQILLAKLVNQTEAIISNARFNSIQTFFNDPGSKICAHGVRFDRDGLEARVFQMKMKDVSQSCPKPGELDDPEDYYERAYNPTQSSELKTDYEVSGALNQLKFGSEQTNVTLGGDFEKFEYIVFIPPDPQVVIFVDENENAQETGVLKIGVGDLRGKVTVTKYGQIDFQYYDHDEGQ